MKYELKMEYNDSEMIRSIVSELYFGEVPGKLNNPFKKGIYIEQEDPNYNEFKGMNGHILRMYNENIDGSLRFSIEEMEDCVFLKPCSIYCVIENNKYNFY